MIERALKIVRLYSGYSQKEMAELIDTTQSFVSEIESGTKKPTLEMIDRYSAALNIRPWQLLMFADKVSESPIANRGRLLIGGAALEFLEKIGPTSRESTKEKVGS